MGKGIISALLGLVSASAVAQQCMNPPLLTSSAPDISFTDKQVVILASDARIAGAEKGVFNGNVHILNTLAQIRADQAQVSAAGQQVSASGNIEFQHPQIDVLSDLIELDNAQSAFVMQDTRYRLNAANAQGQAAQITLSTAAGLALNDVTFSTCPLTQQDWLIKASTITVQPGNSFGEAINTRFYVGGVPVFYLPYFAFPVTSERQSGLLFPKLSSSSENGIDLAVPYYWNIAPNMDATISPRLLTSRGLMLTSELRYLQAQHSGQINVEYLPSDSGAQIDDARHFVRWQQRGHLHPAWTYQIDFNDISDANHIIDFGSDFYNRADTSLNRYLGVTYQGSHTRLDIELQDFTILGEQADNYRAMPRISTTTNLQLNDYWSFQLDTEITEFDNQNPAMHDATRWHLEPTLAFAYRNPWSEFDAQVSYLGSHYTQDITSLPADTLLAAQTDRHIGELKLNGAWFFERPQTLTGEGSLVTLEPRIQYLFTSFADQEQIGIYDTSPLLSTVDNLFRGRYFTGIDRITDNNQMTVAITSRLLTAAGEQRAAFSLGQIFYFADSEVLAIERDLSRSSLVADIDFRLSRRWFAKSQIQLASQSDKVERSSATLEYRRDANSLLQISQRYVRNLSNETINQLGVSAAYPLNQNWQWVGRWYVDREQNRTIETYTGLQYESCCWSIRLVAQRQLLNRYNLDGQRDTNQFDSGVSLQFSFKGLSNEQQNANMLRQGMFGYRQPYFTN